MKKVTGTKEWAASNENLQTGCEHDCKYCYAKSMAMIYRRETVEPWSDPVLAEKKLNKGFRKRLGTIMFPTTHDITPFNIDACIAQLKKMLSAGNKVLVVSKPCTECISKLCESLTEYKDQILFRFTIGSADDDILNFWEPGAPAFDERICSLRLAYHAGFQTSVSCEPMLDANIDAVIEKALPLTTDAIWLGKANRLRQITALNCPNDEVVKKRVEELIGIQNDAAIRDLYNRHKDEPKIKWKDSIKSVIGLDRPTKSGLDI